MAKGSGAGTSRNPACRRYALIMATVVEQLSSLAIGWIESVTASEMRVGLHEETPQATALNAGTPQPFPRINAYVLIPNESGAVVAIVQQIAITRQAPARGRDRDQTVVELPVATRMMTVIPLGTLCRSGQDRDGQPAYQLERGVPALPSVGDPVLLPTLLQLKSIVEASDVDRIVHIGTAPFAGDAKVWVHPDRLFGRHLAILGNTGSGKSCSVAGLVRWSIEAAKAKIEGGQPNARFIILDPNGEYGRAFPDNSIQARRYTVGGTDGSRKLKVPGWLWSGQEWAAFTTAQGQTQRPMLLKAIRELRNSTTLTLADPAQIAARIRSYDAMLRSARETPQQLTDFRSQQEIGANVASLIYELRGLSAALGDGNDVLKDDCGVIADEFENTISTWTFTWQGEERYGAIPPAGLDSILASLGHLIPTLPRANKPRELAEDVPSPFDLDELPGRLRAVAATSPGGGNAANNVEPLVNRIEVLLGDPRLRKVIDDKEGMTLETWLADLIRPSAESPEPVAIIDLSLVPSDITHIVVAVIARLVFQALQRYSKQGEAALPTVLVLEEAHTFVRRDADEGASAPAAEACRQMFERIAREGRKFGLGLVLASQRPSELSATVLAQCNTFLLHRIVNDEDQRLVRRLVPDSLGGLLNELPVLPSQQAILMGWAVPTPVLVKMRHLEPRPKSDDPSFWNVWSGDDSVYPSWKSVASAWSTGDVPTEPVEPSAFD